MRNKVVSACITSIHPLIVDFRGYDNSSVCNDRLIFKRGENRIIVNIHYYYLVEQTPKEIIKLLAGILSDLSGAGIKTRRYNLHTDQWSDDIVTWDTIGKRVITLKEGDYV